MRSEWPLVRFHLLKKLQNEIDVLCGLFQDQQTVCLLVINGFARHSKANYLTAGATWATSSITTHIIYTSLGDKIWRKGCTTHSGESQWKMSNKTWIMRSGNISKLKMILQLPVLTLLASFIKANFSCSVDHSKSWMILEVKMLRDNSLRNLMPESLVIWVKRTLMFLKRRSLWCSTYWICSLSHGPTGGKKISRVMMISQAISSLNWAFCTYSGVSEIKEKVTN